METERNILEDADRIGDLVRSARRIVVLGIKTERQRLQPAFYVPAYLKSAGAEIIPVPVYYPDVQEILGERVHRRLTDVPGPVDIVDVFRRPSHISQHLEDLVTLRPRAVWFQAGIRNEAVARSLASAGILVVQDRCLMVEWRRAHFG